MPLFEQRKCICGFVTAKAEIGPNPAGEYFCPRCGRELTVIKPKKGESEPVAEPVTEPDEQPES